MYTYILYMQVLNECHAVTEFVSCRLTSVSCMYCLYAHTWMYACTMYIYILYMQVLNIVGVLRHLYTMTSTCIYSCVLCSCMHTHGHINVHSLHAVFNGCLAASGRVRVLQHLYTYMYLQDSCSHSKETVCTTCECSTTQK